MRRSNKQMHLLDRVAISEKHPNNAFEALSPVALTHVTAIRVTNHPQQYYNVASYSKAQNRAKVLISSLPLSTTPLFRTTDNLQTKRDSQLDSMTA
jgi:hypothetical protein